MPACLISIFTLSYQFTERSKYNGYIYIYIIDAFIDAIGNNEDRWNNFYMPKTYIPEDLGCYFKIMRKGTLLI